MTSLWRRWAVALGVVLVLLIPAAAAVAGDQLPAGIGDGVAPPSAEDEAAPPDAPPVAAGDNKARAHALLMEGNALAGEGDFGTALEKFRAAYDLFPSVKLLLNIGTSLRHVGRNAEAAHTYERYLAHPEADPARSEELRRILKEIDQVTGRLRIEVNQPGARVRLNGTLLDLTGNALTLRVDPTEHNIVAQKAGFVTVVRTVVVPVREQVVVKLILVRPGTPPPVVIDESAGTTQRVVGYAFGAVGLGALVAGSIFGLLALSTAADAAEHCRSDEPTVCDAEGESLGDTTQVQATASTGLFIAGGALAGIGIVVWLTAPSVEQPQEQTTLSATLLRGQGLGLAFTTRW